MRSWHTWDAEAGDFHRGDRVELHPVTDEWMSGDRYGTVLANGKGQRQRSSGGSRRGRRVTVQLDRSGRIRRYAPSLLRKIGDI